MIHSPIDRRQFVRGASAAALVSAFPAPRASAQSARGEPPVGMCDWTMDELAELSAVPKAAHLGLDGIQVSVGMPERVTLRDPAVLQRYRELGAQHGIRYPSTAAGRVLNQLGLKSEPESAVYVIDALEGAAALGSTNVLLAFFGNGDLRAMDASGDPIDASTGPYREYALDEEGVERVVRALRQIAPRAERAGVLLGLENTLTARQNLDIIERIGSPAVRVYYDVGNSAANGYDVPGEIRMLGNDMITEIHLKESRTVSDHPDFGLLGAPIPGAIDFHAVADACRDIGYDKWYILETRGREGRFEEDTRANIAFVKRVFG